jgi:hypothetical protein
MGDEPYIWELQTTYSAHMCISFFNLVIYMYSDALIWKVNAQTWWCVCPSVNLCACCIWHNQTYLNLILGDNINAVKTDLILLHTVQVCMWLKLNFNAYVKKEGHAQLKNTHTHFICRNFHHDVQLPKGQEKFHAVHWQ